MKAFGIAAILVSVCAMAACQVSSGDGDTGAGGAGGSTTTTTTATTSSTGEGGSNGTGGESGEGGGDANVCAEQSDCDDCCAEQHAAELEELYHLTYWFCGCEAAAPCRDVCDTTDSTSDVCADGVVNLEVDNDACDSCITDAADDCHIAAEEACAEADNCKALIACSDSCQ